MDQIDFSDLNLEEIDWDDPDFEEISSFDLISGPTRAFKVNVETFLQENQNQNTKKKKSAMKVFLEFLLSRNEARYPEFIPLDMLNKYICGFVLSVTKKKKKVAVSMNPQL